MNESMKKSFEVLKRKHPDALLMFRMGDFYEMYREDAQVAHDELNLTMTWRRNTEEDTRMAGFHHHALDTYLPKLIRAGHRVAICDPLPVEKITPANRI